MYKFINYLLIFAYLGNNRKFMKCPMNIRMDKGKGKVDIVMMVNTYCEICR